MPYTVTIRVGPRITRSRHDALGEAIDELEVQLTTLGPAGRRESRKVLTREYGPAAQVAARGDLAGPSRLRPRVTAGADVRGDGSIEVYRGKVHREPIAPEQGEHPFDALRRTLVQ